MPKQFKVLIVEDNAADVALIEAYLAKSASLTFQCYHCSRLEEAEAWIGKNNVDVIILDLNLPDSVGLGTLRIMRKATRLPIIILTGVKDELLAATAATEGAQDYILKNEISPESLARTIRFARNRWRLQNRRSANSNGQDFLAPPVDILLVEDNPADAALVERALAKLEIATRLHHLFDGEEGLSFLRKEGAYVDTPRPKIVLLDLNLPKMSGREVLQQIKTNPALKDIPVIILSSMREADSVSSVYADYANSFVAKPESPEEFFQVIKKIEEFWFQAAELPDAV